MTPEGFWAKVAHGRRDQCWLWTGSINPYGYGRVWTPGRRSYRMAHRVAYAALRGDIPPGLQLDHLCRVRRCVNPWHLELVTLKENVLRGVGKSAENARRVECVNGHPFDEPNTRIENGKRRCRACGRDRQARYLQRKAVA